MFAFSNSDQQNTLITAHTSIHRSIRVIGSGSIASVVEALETLPATANFGEDVSSFRGRARSNAVVGV